MKSTYLKIAAILILTITISSCTKSIKKYEEPKGLITSEQADKMEEAYKENQYKFINEFLSKNGVAINDNREVWFSLEEIENYIHYVKQESEKQGLENLGLRVYFGAKQDTNGDYKSTIFFTPTNNSTTRGVSDNLNTDGINSLNYGSSGEPAFEFIRP